MPALPLDEAGKYVAGAYVVFLALLLIYVGIMATRLQRIDRQLGELADLAEREPDRGAAEAPDADADGVRDQRARPDEEGSSFEPERSGRREVIG
jgi:hypothetical protein